MNPSLLDRVLALAPLGALAYLIHQNRAERRDVLRALEAERESFRGERRELLNRLQFPYAMPVGTDRKRPTDRDPSRSAAERAEWAQVGTAALPTFLPTDRDDVPGTD